MRHIAFVVADHVLTIAITLALVFGVLSATGAMPRGNAAAAAIDVKTPVIVRYETPDGQQIRPPETMPLWQYVQGADNTNRFALADFKAAFENDVHAGDGKWENTHELIDGHEF